MLVRPTIAADSAHMMAKAFPAPASRLPSRLIVRIVVTLSHPVWMDASVLSIWEERMKERSKERRMEGWKDGRMEGKKERRKEGKKERRKEGKKKVRKEVKK